MFPVELLFTEARLLFGLGNSFFLKHEVLVVLLYARVLLDGGQEHNVFKPHFAFEQLHLRSLPLCVLSLAAFLGINVSFARLLFRSLRRFQLRKSVLRGLF